MTPERMAGLVTRWVRLYTRDLPPSVAARRIGEIDADLHDHIAHERAGGVSDREIALDLASRMLRGLAADATWRRRQAKASRPATREVPKKMTKTLYRPAVRVALGVAIVLSLPLAATLLSDGSGWSVADFVLAGILLAVVGVALEMAIRKAGNLGTAIGIAALGAAAAVFGEADDAPGLVLLGIVLIASAGAIGLRSRMARQGG